MLEIRRGDKASKYFENAFFRPFSRELANLFKLRSWQGLLIGFPQCLVDKDLSPDILLLTKHRIFLIDLKNVGGRIKLPAIQNFSSEPWSATDGDRTVEIRAGNSINPFVQLTRQRERLSQLLKPEKSKITPERINRIVCFQQPVRIDGAIPGEEHLSFFVASSENIQGKIEDVINTESRTLKLNEDDFKKFSKLFAAAPYDPDKPEPIVTGLEKMESSDKLDYSLLKSDSKDALEAVTTFLSSDKQVFCLTGASGTGKTFLIPYIRERVFNTGYSGVEILTTSYRVARHLGDALASDEVGSLYGRLYDFSQPDQAESAVPADAPPKETTEDNDNDAGNIFPLRKDEQDDATVYIVDAAHLLNNKRSDIAGLRFGSGQLLRDFLDYAPLKNSRRKLIFIGDPYIIRRSEKGRENEYALSSEYLEAQYSLTTQSYHLSQPAPGHVTWAHLEPLVNAIQTKSFNTFNIVESDSLKITAKSAARALCEKLVRENQFHFVCFTKDTAVNANRRVREILGQQDSVAPGDSLLVASPGKAQTALGDITTTLSLYAGDFLRVTKVLADKKFSTVISHGLPSRQSHVDLVLRRVDATAEAEDRTVAFWLIENLLPGAEYDEKIRKAQNQLADQELRKAIEIRVAAESVPVEEAELRSQIGVLEKSGRAGPDHDVKLLELRKALVDAQRMRLRKIRQEVRVGLSNDLESSYFALKNAVACSFGWAINLDKAVAYKWQDVFVSIKPWVNRKRQSELYFREVYTALSRAAHQIHVLDYESRSPYSNMKITNGEAAGDLKYTLVVPPSARENPANYLADFVISRLAAIDIQVGEAKTAAYRVQFPLTTLHGSMNLIFDFNKEGHVSTRFDAGTTLVDDMKVIQQAFTSLPATVDFSQQDEWLSEALEDFSERLHRQGIIVHAVESAQYLVRLHLAYRGNLFSVDMNFTKDQLFTRFSCKKTSNTLLIDDFYGAVEHAISDVR